MYSNILDKWLFLKWSPNQSGNYVRLYNFKWYLDYWSLCLLLCLLWIEVLPLATTSSFFDICQNELTSLVCILLQFEFMASFGKFPQCHPRCNSPSLMIWLHYVHVNKGNIDRVAIVDLLVIISQLLVLLLGIIFKNESSSFEVHALSCKHRTIARLYEAFKVAVGISSFVCRVSLHHLVGVLTLVEVRLMVIPWDLVSF